MADIAVFLPPTGRLLLACDDGQLAGYACSRTIGDRIGELKRMYAGLARL